ncbi:MAG TPA: SDR family oxidoreductase [Dongiaceae bacterium]|nr:SDR family oxidoreductase [Dongiaceae bacterium]
MSEPGRVRTALVTGASSGIGLEIARLLARDGAQVLMVARDEERLKRAAAWLRSESTTTETRSLAIDLARPEAAARVHAWATAEAGAVDFLVNNAGVGTGGRFVAGDPEADRELLALNIDTLVALTRPFLRDMIAARRGRILNVASMAAFLPGPLMATYYASKAFVLSFSEALAEETRHTGVTVTTLCPGPVPTGFQKRAGLEKAAHTRGPLVMSAGAVAQAGYRGALEGRGVVIPGAMNWMVIQALRLVPRAALAGFVRRANAGIEAPHDAAPRDEPPAGS